MKLSYSTLHAAIWRLALAIKDDLAPWEYATPGMGVARPECVGRRDLDAVRELIRSAEPWMRRDLCRCFRTTLDRGRAGSQLAGGAA